jgi:hypothetical protein
MGQSEIVETEYSLGSVPPDEREYAGYSEDDLV